MAKKIIPSLNNVVSFVLGILIITIISIQIITLNENTTIVETTLFNILQFVFSIAFAWHLSSIVSQNEFRKSQKKFAVSAYRRINEIKKGVERLSLRLNSQKDISFQETKHELEIIDAITESIHETIISSIADWGEIIGEELKSIEKIEEFEREKMLLTQKSHLEYSPNSSDEKDKLLVEIEEKSGMIEKLLSELPVEMQLNEKDKQSTSYSSLSNSALEEMDMLGFIKLKCFWREDFFDTDINSYNLGDKLVVEVGSLKSSTKVLLVKDKSGHILGQVLNYFGDKSVKYSTFRDWIIHYLGRPKFEVELLNMDPYLTKNKIRNFELKIIQ